MSTSHWYPLGLAAAVFGAVGCRDAGPGQAGPQSNQVPADVRAAIDRANAANAAAMLRQDAGAVAALYTEDVTSPTSTDILRGRAAKLAATEARFKAGRVLARYDSTDLVRPLGDGYALEIGRWGVTLADSAGRPVPSKGRYLVVWRRDPDGVWRVLSDIGNQTPDVPIRGVSPDGEP